MKAVSKTAFYCCGVRMMDAESDNPIINDQYARRLMGEEGLHYWENYKNFTRPNGGNTARTYLIDSKAKEILNADPNHKVFLIGAGLDSRAFRIPGGIWHEFDEPAIMEYKNEVLPIEETQNELHRIPINFATEKLKDKLAPYRTEEKVLIIIEGVIMYLTNDQLQETLITLKEVFPNHKIMCDLMKKDFFNVFSQKIHKELVKSGTTFQDIDNYPDRLFMENGYKQIAVTSTAKTAVNKGKVKLPKFLVNQMLGSFMMGYSVYEFDMNTPQ